VFDGLLKCFSRRASSTSLGSLETGLGEVPTETGVGVAMGTGDHLTQADGGAVHTRHAQTFVDNLVESMTGSTPKKFVEPH